MERRDFLKTIASTAAVSTCLGASVAQAAKSPKTSKPDMLIIMPDQMRGDCLSILDHPVMRTTQLDALARQGALFRRAYSTVASCIPARYALLTGLYPQTSGVVGFRAKPFETPPLGELLGKAGYSTVLVGRNMHQVSASKSCGYQKRVLGSTYINNDSYDQFLRREAPKSGGIKKLVRSIGVTYNHWQAKPWPLADNLHPTAWVVAESRKIVAQADANKPLFLTTSFYAPHPPLFPPKKYFDAYAKKKLPAPARGDWVNWKALSTKGDRGGHRVLLEGETLRAAQAGYFGLIEHLDTEIAPLIRDFKARSEKAGRSWVIVVISDHGEMLGDHGYFRKCEPYEGVANIPFIICGSPALGFKAAQRIGQPVCLEDIMPTLLSLAGTKSPARVDGVDLTPTLRGQKQMIRKWLHFEHAPCYSQAQAYHALTDGRFKYIWRTLDGREHLFDLEKDPSEVRDLSDDATHKELLAKWRSIMLKRLANRPEGFSKNGKLIAGRPYR
ncbi:MAG: sulfatase-like hydrolase/transferase, partial [bacterium]|nr:sulfatase-like hydrolase/transferase [bacterium]